MPDDPGIVKRAREMRLSDTSIFVDQCFETRVDPPCAVCQAVERGIAKGLAKAEEVLVLAREAVDFYWPHDEHGECAVTPDREEPYWGARADKLRAALQKSPTQSD